MPTGYTAPLCEDKEMTFEQFVLLCARRFGALISMFNEPFREPIPKEFVDEYHKRKYEKAKADYENFKQHPPTDEELEKAYAKYVQKEMDHAKKANEIAVFRRQRYEAMLEKVRRWEPPTDKHVHLKEFMVKQLEESIDCDCREYHPHIVEKQEWIEYERSAKFYEDNFRVSKERLEKDIKSYAERNAWTKSLLDSLRAFEKGGQA